MKLLRLISNQETEADYTCTFQETIRIKPNSKICLQNLSLFLDDIIEVTNENRGISMTATTLTTGEEVEFCQALMNVGVYNFQQFLVELERALNEGLNNPIGYLAQENDYMEITVTLDNTNRVNINYALANPTINGNTTLAGVTYDGDTGYFKDNGIEPEAWAFVFGNVGATLTKGQKFCQVQIDDDLGSLDGVAVGFAPWATFNSKISTVVDGTPDMPNMTPSDYTLCVYTNGLTGTYWKKTRAGNLINTNVDYVAGDYIQFGAGRTNEPGTSAYSSKLIIQVRRYDEGNIIELHSENTASEEKLNFGVSMNNATNMVFDIEFVESQAGGQATAPVAPYRNYKLYFSSGSEELLGFNERIKKNG